MSGHVAQGAAGAGYAGILKPVPVHPHFGARVEGLDIREPLTPAQITALEAVMDQYGIVVLPGQNLTDDDQVRFAEQFGRIEDTPTLVDQERRRLENKR